MTAPSRLLDTHPRIGRAAFEAHWEQEMSSEILDHRYERAHCAECGAVERCHRITDRLLAGPNAGSVATWLWRRPECAHRSACLSSYRAYRW